jgi:membrane associated rhomboid family serine protease
VKTSNYRYGSAAESIIYPLLIELMMLVAWWAEKVMGHSLVNLGVKPGEWSHWYGLFLMPLLHDPDNYEHILNNSIPFLILTCALFYYYRDIAWRVLGISWFGTGLLVWLFAEPGHVHIGMSGVLYALFGFLFISGFFKQVRNLQVLSLAVSFIYGSMIWGIFPNEQGISWEGHFAGLLIGVSLAVVFRKHGPVRKKFQYEIEHELGIEPPDFEGQWIQRQEEQEQLQRIQEELIQRQQQALHIVYHIKPQQAQEEKPADDNGNED